jgi:hypothetical protein
MAVDFRVPRLQGRTKTGLSTTTLTREALHTYPGSENCDENWDEAALVIENADYSPAASIRANTNKENVPVTSMSPFVPQSSDHRTMGQGKLEIGSRTQRPCGAAVDSTIQELQEGRDQLDERSNGGSAGFRAPAPLKPKAAAAKVRGPPLPGSSRAQLLPETSGSRLSGVAHPKAQPPEIETKKGAPIHQELSKAETEKLLMELERVRNALRIQRACQILEGKKPEPDVFQLLADGLQKKVFKMTVHEELGISAAVSVV